MTSGSSEWRRNGREEEKTQDDSTSSARCVGMSEMSYQKPTGEGWRDGSAVESSSGHPIRQPVIACS